MIPKRILLVVLTLFVLGQIFAQRRTTNVRGYYRKDGTYVRSHTRSYNPVRGASSSNYYGSTRNAKSADDIPLTTLNPSVIERSDYDKKTSAHFGSSEKILATTLSPVQNDTLAKNDALKKSQIKSPREL